jgi:hypothetical protein
VSKVAITIGWDAAPHLTEQDKAELAAAYPLHEKDARTKGIPTLGSGAIFPIGESQINCDPFAIPDYWPRAYGMDVGWNKTAAVWGARNNDTGVIYLYHEHYRGLEVPDIHANAIKAAGAWIPGVIDPAADSRSQIDGRKLLSIYLGLGLDLEKAANAVEAAIHQIWLLMVSGKLKVFKSLGNWWEEFRQFQRDTDGSIVDDHKFHLMACTRYFILSGRDRMRVKPVPKQEDDWERMISRGTQSDMGWMG